MVIDFLIGIAASIVASFICGFFTKKAFGKNSDILTSIYAIFISFSVFAFSVLLCFMLSDPVKSIFEAFSGQNAYSLIRSAMMLFWILFVNVSVVTIVFIIVRQIELTGKAAEKLVKKTPANISIQKEEK